MEEKKYYNDCFTEVEENKINAKFNKTTMKCFDSVDSKFSMDCEGNLVVNSIITREQNANTEVPFDQIYPVGSIYISVIATNPSTLFGGTWEQIKGKFLLGSNGNFPLGSTGGEESHTLTINEMPSHNHGIGYSQTGTLGSSQSRIIGNQVATVPTGNTGGGAAHNNMPPYLVVNIWKRVS